MKNHNDDTWDNIIDSIIKKHEIIFNIYSDSCDVKNKSNIAYDTLRVFTSIVFKMVNTTINQHENVFESIITTYWYSIIHNMFDELTMEEKEQIMLRKILDTVTGDMICNGFIDPFEISFTPDEMSKWIKEKRFLSFDTDD